MLWRRRRRARGDPWQTAITQHFASAEGQPEAPSETKRWTLQLSAPWLVVTAAVVLLMLVGAGYLGALAIRNHDTANRWRDRSVQLESLVVDRTEVLNRQTARLNVASNKLRSARRKIRRSESDVTQLEERQRQLAAEKATVEDERAALSQQQRALSDVASQLVACNSGLVQIIQALGGGFAPGSARVSEIANTCRGASDAVDIYVATYGSG